MWESILGFSVEPFVQHFSFLVADCVELVSLHFPPYLKGLHAIVITINLCCELLAFLLSLHHQSSIILDHQPHVEAIYLDLIRFLEHALQKRRSHFLRTLKNMHGSKILDQLESMRLAVRKVFRKRLLQVI